MMRGQVFNIEGKRFFTYGGALSYYEKYRHVGQDWWLQELPDEDKLREGFRNLNKWNKMVDYVITHDCPTHLLNDLPPYSRKPQTYGLKICESSEHLETISRLIKIKRWYFGHYHLNRRFGTIDAYTKISSN